MIIIIFWAFRNLSDYIKTIHALAALSIVKSY